MRCCQRGCWQGCQQVNVNRLQAMQTSKTAKLPRFSGQFASYEFLTFSLWLLHLDDVPLFVSESSSDDKRKSIRQSDYLSFCHEQLMAHKDALCIFGHSLGEQDQHLIDAHWYR